MLKIRGVLNSIMDWTYNLPWNKPYSNQLRDVINTTSHPQVPIWGSDTKIEHKIWTRVWEEMVLLKMLMKIGLPKMRGVSMMRIASIPSSGREVPLTESLRRRAKVLLPKFHLGAVAIHPESPSPPFFRFCGNLYQKMGTRSGHGWAPPTRASQEGAGTPWWVLCTLGPLSGGF